MEISTYDYFPSQARDIRKAVFIDEQGFEDEFDYIDEKAVHIVAFIDGEAVATCRVFFDDKQSSYILGRLAVLKPYRGRNIGKIIVGKAEEYVRSQSGKSLSLHAQCAAMGFYATLGFEEYGEIEYEQSCPHKWMRKSLV